MLNIKEYHKKQKMAKKIVYVDPSVYELKDSVEYSNIEFLHELASGKLLENEYISIDYPCDMNLAYADLFIEKSVKNNLKYKDNPKYICTVQFKFEDFVDFKRNFEYLEQEVDIGRKIVGIGNLCRIMRPNEFTDRVFEFLYQKPAYNYHFYGLGLALIKKYLPKFRSCSVDSTKWTRACHGDLKKKYGVCAKYHTRNIFFEEYIRQLLPYFNKIEY